MNLRIYLIIEEGADRVYVCGTGYPAWYVKPKDRRAEIVGVDIPLQDVEVDRVVKLGPELVRVVGATPVPTPGPISLRVSWCICAGWPHTDACLERRKKYFCTCGVLAGDDHVVDPNQRWRHARNCAHGYR